MLKSLRLKKAYTFGVSTHLHIQCKLEYSPVFDIITDRSALHVGFSHTIKKLNIMFHIFEDGS